MPMTLYFRNPNTVRELVDLTNADPRRGVGHEKVLTKIKVDAAAEELVREQGFTLDDVPPVETMVKLALTGNMSTGGISIDRISPSSERAEQGRRLKERARLGPVVLSQVGVRLVLPAAFRR